MGGSGTRGKRASEGRGAGGADREVEVEGEKEARWETEKEAKKVEEVARVRRETEALRNL